MSHWAKAHHTLRSHPKIMKAGDQAAWLFFCSILYANEHLTDGLIERDTLPSLSPSTKNPQAKAARLVEVGLWHEVTAGWVIHDFLDHQPSAHDVRKRRMDAVERQAKARAARENAESEASGDRV